jgi:hypothetical protein
LLREARQSRLLGGGLGTYKYALELVSNLPRSPRY